MINKNNQNYIFIFAFIISNILIFNSYADSIDKQVSEISNELLCPVCRGQTVAESNSDLANDFRDIIKTKLQEGQSREEILNYFISRYGDSVLSSPPAKGIRLIIWILPVAVLLFGLISLIRFLKIKSKIQERSIRPIENDKYLNDVDKELNKLD